jgi:dinuclear metal center YbgI/SA1388 family protein
MLARMSQTLSDVTQLLEQLAPLELAEDWDNVGLLLEPSGSLARPVTRAFFCIDLSERVLDEALERQVDLVVAYHPPLFKGQKRLRASAPSERVLVRALEAKLPIYSPHTALDAAENGVNDWLARGLGAGKSQALVPHTNAATPNTALGAGRLLELSTPISVVEAVARLKAHLGVPTLRVAISGAQAAGGPIRRVAVCAGAGGSLFERVSGVDLFVTGELRHHDVLSKLQHGASVILSEHSHTERGFLPEFAERLRVLARGELEVIVSTLDADPLRTL